MGRRARMEQQSTSVQSTSLNVQLSPNICCTQARHGQFFVLKSDSYIGRSLIEYGEGDLVEHQFTSLAASQAYQPQQPVLWLNVHGLHEPDVMAEIGRRFKLHPLVLEDILNTNQRPKIDDYGDYLFMVARFFEIGSENNQIGSDQVSLILGANFVLTFQERPSGRFDPVRERLRQDRGQIRKLGADYLAWLVAETTQEP